MNFLHVIWYFSSAHPPISKNTTEVIRIMLLTWSILKVIVYRISSNAYSELLIRRFSRIPQITRSFHEVHAWLKTSLQGSCFYYLKDGSTSYTKYIISNPIILEQTCNDGMNFNSLSHFLDHIRICSILIKMNVENYWTKSFPNFSLELIRNIMFLLIVD